MKAVVGLLVMVLGVSHGVECHCDGKKDGAQCYGALGGTVVIQLMDSASEILRYQWFKNKTLKILDVKNNKTLSNLIEDRSVFTPSNGTFRINNLNWSDGAEYTLIISDSNGKESEQRTLQLSFQAPVSSVHLASECLSQGEMRVSCSSEGGDSPQYSWTLDGHTLTDHQLLSGSKETNIITLKQNVPGLLVCSVRNHISNVSKAENISTCGFKFINCTSSNGTNISQWVYEANNTLCIKPTTPPITSTDSMTSTEGKETVSIRPSTNITPYNQTTYNKDDPWYISYLPIIGGVLTALVFLLIIGVAVVCSQRKKQSNKPKEEEDGQELTYAEVNVVQRQGRRMHQREETEVEYGQVKFSRQPQSSVVPTQDECVYSQVRKNK